MGGRRGSALRTAQVRVRVAPTVITALDEVRKLRGEGVSRSALVREYVVHGLQVELAKAGRRNG